MVPNSLTNNGRPEPLDRIDFIYQKGNLTVLKSDDLGVGKPSPMSNHNNNEWASDQAAVLTLYGLASKGPGPCVPLLDYRLNKGYKV
jgi:hypothetical protein